MMDSYGACEKGQKLGRTGLVPHGVLAADVVRSGGSPLRTIEMPIILS